MKKRVWTELQYPLTAESLSDDPNEVPRVSTLFGVRVHVEEDSITVHRCMAPALKAQLEEQGLATHFSALTFSDVVSDDNELLPRVVRNFLEHTNLPRNQVLGSMGVVVPQSPPPPSAPQQLWSMGAMVYTACDTSPSPTSPTSPTRPLVVTSCITGEVANRPVWAKGTANRESALAACMVAATIGSGVDVRESELDTAGRGLFSTRNFSKGSLITEYAGNRLADRLAAADCFPQTHIICMPAGHHLGNAVYIDGDREPVPGNGGGSFANHKDFIKDCNAMFVLRQVPNRDEGTQMDSKIYLEATCDINAEQEIYVKCGNDGNLDVMMGRKRYIRTTDANGQPAVAVTLIQVASSHPLACTLLLPLPLPSIQSHPIPSW